MYTGLIAEIPVGFDGMTGTKNVSQAKPTELLVARNVTYENGTVQKEGGADKYNATAISGGPSILGGHDWWPDPSVQRMIVFCSDGKVYKDSGSGTFPTVVGTGFNTNEVVPVFFECGKESAAGNRKLVFITGKDAPKFISGDANTFSSFTSVPADWSGSQQPVTATMHEGRAWYALGHRLYYSSTADHTDVNGAGSGVMAVFPGEGSEIRAIASYKGILVVWKYPRGVYIVDTSDPVLANWRVTRVSGAVGIAGPRAWTALDDDLTWVDESGNIQLLSAVQRFGSVAPRNLSQEALMRPFIETYLSLTRLKYVQAVYYEAKRQAHFAWSRSGSSTNDSRLVIDFLRLDRPRFRFSDRDVAQSIWMRLDSTNIARPVIGDDAGFVWLLDRDSRAKGGLGYQGEFQTPPDDLSRIDPALATKRKNGDFLELVVEPKGNWNLSVDILWDGTIKQTVVFNMGTTGAAIGSFVLGTDLLGGDQILNKKKRIVGSGTRFSIIGRNGSAGEDFSVARAYLYFRPSDEKK
jgi:hypothetical protein